MNIMEQVNHNIKLAVLSLKSANELVAMVLAAKPEERRAMVLGYIGGDDGVKREATG